MTTPDLKALSDAATRMTYDELNARQHAMAYAILGGAVVPKLLDTLSTEYLVGFIKAERAQARDTLDALVAAAAAEAREAALREVAIAIVAHQYPESEDVLNSCKLREKHRKDIADYITTWFG